MCLQESRNGGTGKIWPAASGGFQILTDILLAASEIAAFNTFLDNRRMTLVAAMKCQDYILLAADSEAGDDTDMKRTVNKIYGHPNLPLACGTCGSYQLGVDFGKWFMEDMNTPKTWNDLRMIATEYLSSINGHRRKMMELSGELPDGPKHEDFFCAAIIAGYMNGKPEILEIGFDGTEMFVLENLAGC